MQALHRTKGAEPFLRVAAVMSHPVIAIPVRATVREAAALMRRHGVGLLIVIDGDRSIGIVTDRDIVVRLLPDVVEAGDHPVRDAMSKDPVACFADQTVPEAAAIMGDEQVRRLVVLDRSGRLVGFLSIGDIAEHVSEELAGQALGEIVETRSSDAGSHVFAPRA